MNNNDKKEPSSNILSELEISNSERKSSEERIDREKNVFAETLKNSIGEEMKAVLLEKKDIDARPQKKSKIKEFFERLARTCQ